MTGTPARVARAEGRFCGLRWRTWALGGVLAGLGHGPGAAASTAPGLLLPGPLTHGVFVARPDAPEGAVPEADLRAYARAVGQAPGYVYLTHNWFAGRDFPAAQVRRVRARGAVPIVRLMLRSTDDEATQTPERVYTLERLLRGDFDGDLRAWAREAARQGPLYAEFGTEMNGEWFHWNARWQGRAAGAATFRRAYRHLINVTRRAGAGNVRWIFHVNAADAPDTSWNRFERYYPGGEFISLLGVSAYGAQTPFTPREEVLSLREQLDPAHARLRWLAPGKPILLLEFGSAADAPVPPEVWADAALRDLTSGRWLGLRGFSWWNSAWDNWNGDRRLAPTEMRVQLQPRLAAVFRKWLRRPEVRREPGSTRAPRF